MRGTCKTLRCATSRTSKLRRFRLAPQLLAPSMRAQRMTFCATNYGAALSYHSLPASFRKPASTRVAAVATETVLTTTYKRVRLSLVAVVAALPFGVLIPTTRIVLVQWIPRVERLDALAVVLSLSRVPGNVGVTCMTVAGADMAIICACVHHAPFFEVLAGRLLCCVVLGRCSLPFMSGISCVTFLICWGGHGQRERAR